MIEKHEIHQAMAGARVELEYMDDAFAPPSGTQGTITHVDGIGQIHVKWDNGSNLAIIPGEDVFRFLYN